MTLAFAQSANAQRPTAPQILPNYTLAVVRIADVPLLSERFQQTAMGRVGQDPQMQPLVGQVYKAAQDAFKPIENAVGLPLSQLLKLPQGEVCAAFVGPPDLDQSPGFVLVVDTKDEVAQGHKLLTAVEQIAFRNGGSRGSEKLAGEEVTTF